MSFTISAPYPYNQTTIVLPNPQLGNSEAHASEVIIKRTMSGRAQTFVRRKNQRKKLQWAFRVTRNKALEVREFFRSYHGSKMNILDHEGRTWTGYVITNPIDIDIPRRGHPGGEGYQQYSGNGETCEFQVEFQAWEFDTGDRPPHKVELNITSSSNNCDDPNRIPVRQQVFCTVSYARQATLDAMIKHRWDASELVSINDGAQVLEVPDLGYGSRKLVPYAPWWDRPDGYPDYAPHLYQNAFGTLPGIYFGTVKVGPDPRVSNDRPKMATSSLQTWHTDMRFWNGVAKKGTVFLVYRNAIGYPPGHDLSYRWFQMTGSRVNFAIHRQYIPASGTYNNAYYQSLLRRRRNIPEECFCLEPGRSTLRPASYWLRYDGQTRIHPALGYSNINRNQPEGRYDGTLDGMSLTVRGRPYLFTLLREDGTDKIRFRMNGQENKGITVDSTVTAPGRLYFASGNTIGTPGRGFMGEMRIYRESLGEDDLVAVERELMLKWGVPNRHWQQEEECFNDLCVVSPQWCSEAKIPYYKYSNKAVTELYPDYACVTEEGEDCP